MPDLAQILADNPYIRDLNLARDLDQPCAICVFTTASGSRRLLAVAAVGTPWDAWPAADPDWADELASPRAADGMVSPAQQRCPQSCAHAQLSPVLYRSDGLCAWRYALAPSLWTHAAGGAVWRSGRWRYVISTGTGTAPVRWRTWRRWRGLRPSNSSALVALLGPD